MRAVTNLEARTPVLHPSTSALLRYFDYSHLYGPLRPVSQEVHRLAWDMATALPQGPELTTGLRKLLEAKDCFVRAALDMPRSASELDAAAAVAAKVEQVRERPQIPQEDVAAGRDAEPEPLSPQEPRGGVEGAHPEPDAAGRVVVADGGAVGDEEHRGGLHDARAEARGDVPSLG